MGQRRMHIIQVALAVALLLAGTIVLHPSVKAPGPTYVGGEVHGTWDLEESPYIVIENAIVPSGQTLTIEPGVEVRFNLNTGILVHGQILASGLEGKTINFTSNQTTKDPGQWSGITMSISSKENHFDFTTIEYAVHGIRCTESSTVSIGNSAIRYNSLSGVNVVLSYANIRESNITENKAGVIGDDAEVDIIGSVLMSNTDYALALFYSAATVESTRIIGNHDGIMAMGSEVHIFDSAIDSTMSTLWLTDASFVATVDTFFPISSVVFDGIQSTLVVQWTLKVRVLDIYASGVEGAQVTLEGALTDTAVFNTDQEGWIETQVIREMVKTNTEEVSYNPYWVNASSSGFEDGAEVLVNEPMTVVLKLTGDIVAPEAAAGQDRTVDEDEAVLFNAGDSIDDDPDFFTTGSFMWTFHDYDGDHMESGVAVSHVFNTPGIYSVKLRAEDAFGNWDTDYLEVSVTDITDPTALASVPEETKRGEEVVLDGSASTDNDPQFSSTGNYTWTIDLGSEDVVLYGKIVEHAFERSGTFTVSLEVKDGAGNNAVSQKTIRVMEEPEEFPYLPLLGLALIGIAFAGAANTEAGRYWFLKFLILPLYVKLTKKDILDHFIRGQIYGYLVVNPGDNYTTIKRNLDLKNGTLTYHLDVLEREGFVKSQLRGSKRYYYPKGIKMPENGTGFPAIKEDIIRRVEETPGITISDLASLLGVSRQLTNYHLRTLIREGYVYTERKGMRTRIYPVERDRMHTT